ncbi:MAG: TIGR03905 family TSCPD domain-containing protein [Muribaculaceae bacterium]|nr:TIGR03905 family TSCPD domain-containing protein [Muribaculaceae bacterium]
MKYTYYPSGTCSRQIDFEIEDNIIKQVLFTGGCHGNLQGISRLVQGMSCDEAIAKLEGIRCGYKPTSCPDQFAKALKKAMQDYKDSH